MVSIRGHPRLPAIKRFSWLLCLFWLMARAVGAMGLPELDGECSIPAQSWMHAPGPRQIILYLSYPKGALTNVTPATGVMLTLHNWGGTGNQGTADARQLANRYNVVAIAVDYLQSGPWSTNSPAPYDFGYLQALDALRALYFVFNGLDQPGKPFARGRVFATGGSGGGNVALMANKLAPRTFACVIDLSGMAKLSDDIAFGSPISRLNAGYSRAADSPRYLSKSAQELRFVGHPRHLQMMKQLGNTCKVVVIHGATDATCPVADKREMVENMRVAGIDIDARFISDQDLDGKVFKDTGHSLGDRTLIVFQVADGFLPPDSPTTLIRSGTTDFERRDADVKYQTAEGTFVISYESGIPVGQFMKE